MRDSLAALSPALLLLGCLLWLLLGPCLLFLLGRLMWLLLLGPCLLLLLGSLLLLHTIIKKRSVSLVGCEKEASGGRAYCTEAPMRCELTWVSSLVPVKTRKYLGSPRKGCARDSGARGAAGETKVVEGARRLPLWLLLWLTPEGVAGVTLRPVAGVPS